MFKTRTFHLNHLKDLNIKYILMNFTNLSFRVFHGGVVGTSGRDGIPVLDLLNCVHRIKGLRLLRVAASNLLDLAVAELVAGDYRR